MTSHCIFSEQTMNTRVTKNPVSPLQGGSGTVGKVRRGVGHGDRRPHWQAFRLRAAVWSRPECRMGYSKANDGVDNMKRLPDAGRRKFRDHPAPRRDKRNPKRSLRPHTRAAE